MISEEEKLKRNTNLRKFHSGKRCLTCILCIILSGCVAPVYSQKAYPENFFRAPLDIPMLLSGNFAELRADHFHSGIDIKTQGVSGKRIYAAADGYISRIKIESGGYGKTLYIHHPEGYTTVYAHLSSFKEEISRYVREKQYESQLHAMNIYPEKDHFPVKKGEVIAFSGNSGYSFGPHLHFEIRNAANQHPLNVLCFGLDIKDSTDPVIYSIFIYPIGIGSTVNNSSLKLVLPVSRKNGEHIIEGERPIEASGEIGIGLEAYDYLDGSRNRCGIYTTDLLVNRELINRIRMDEFSFSESRYINSLMDYEEKQKSNRNIFKTYIDPNNNLSIYETTENSGIINIKPDSVYDIQLVLSDAYGNTSELEFQIKGNQPSIAATPTYPDSEIVHMPWQIQNNFENEYIRLNIPPKAFYTDIRFSYSYSDPIESSYSRLHNVNNRYTPVHLPFEIMIKPEGMPVSLYEKAVLVTVDEEGEMNYTGGELNDGWIASETRSFGQYAVALDTTEPEIQPVNIPQSLDMTGKSSIRFIVTDDLSGIQSYEGYINNEWALFEYDAKNDLVYYSFDPGRITKGSNHELELYIIDNKDNISFYYTEFYW